MPYLFLAIRRAFERDQRRNEFGSEPFWKLLFGEVPILARRIGAVRVATILIAFFVLLIAGEIALNEATPGPILTPRWRVVVALGGTVLFTVIWTIVHAIRSVGWNSVNSRKRPDSG